MTKNVFTTIVFFVALAALAPVVRAQESNWRFSFDPAIGITHYKNYSALSLMPDATAEYSGLTTQFTFGAEYKGFGLALRQSTTDINTSALAQDERVRLQEYSLMLRAPISITRQLELMASVGIGYLRVQNHFYASNWGAVRHGINTEFEIELRYRVSRSIYLFARAAIGYGQTYTRPDALPNEAVLGPKQGFLNTRFGGGIGFGFQPTKKRLSSPPELTVADGDYPLLVELR